MSGEGINPGLAATQANIAQELMEEDLKRELERNQLATKMAMAKEQEAQEAKVRSVSHLYILFMLTYNTTFMSAF